MAFDETTSVWLILLVNLFMGFGMGNVMAPATTRMTLALPPERSGAGSALQNTVRQVAGSLGLAVISSIVAISYASGLKPELTGLPTEAADAALESIGGAHGVAAEVATVNPQAGQSLLDLANSAYLDAMQIGAWVSMALVLAAIALVVWRMPVEAHKADWTSSHTADPEPEDAPTAAGVADV